MIENKNVPFFTELAQPPIPKNEEKIQLSEDTEKTILIENQEVIPYDRDAFIDSIIIKHFKEYDSVFRALAKL